MAAATGYHESSPMRRRQRRPRVASSSARRKKKAGIGRELGSGAAPENAGPAYPAALLAAATATILVGTTAGFLGPIRLVVESARLSDAAGACARAGTAGAGAGNGAGAGAGGSSPRLRIRTSSITIRCLGFSLVGEGCLRAGLAGGERRPTTGAAGPLGTGDATGIFGGGEPAAAGLGTGELTAAAILGGGETEADGLGWRRRRGLEGEAANASRCILLASASWDLSTAVAMTTAAEPHHRESRFTHRRSPRTRGEDVGRELMRCCCAAGPNPNRRGRDLRGRKEKIGRAHV